MLAEDGIKKAIEDYRSKNPSAKIDVEASKATKESESKLESQA